MLITHNKHKKEKRNDNNYLHLGVPFCLGVTLDISCINCFHTFCMECILAENCFNDDDLIIEKQEKQNTVDEGNE